MAQSDADTNLFLTEIEAAKVLRLSFRTLQAWRVRGGGPPYLKMGAAVRYDRKAILDWAGGGAGLRGSSIAAASLQPPNGRRSGLYPSGDLLPPPVAKRLIAELSNGWAGQVRMSVATHRNLMRAISPLEGEIMRTLSKTCEILPNNVFRLAIARNEMYSDAHIPDHQDTITVHFDNKSGHWISDTAAGTGGFDQLCQHIFRIQGRLDADADRDLLALIGAACLTSFARGVVE